MQFTDDDGKPLTLRFSGKLVYTAFLSVVTSGNTDIRQHWFGLHKTVPLDGTQFGSFPDDVFITSASFVSGFPTFNWMKLTMYNTRALITSGDISCIPRRETLTQEQGILNPFSNRAVIEHCYGKRSGVTPSNFGSLRASSLMLLFPKEGQSPFYLLQLLTFLCLALIT